jgi:hypothetical protein
LVKKAHPPLVQTAPLKINGHGQMQMTDDSAQRMALVKSKLAPIYNAARRWEFSEECLVLLLIRESSYETEVDTVVNYFNGLTSAQRKFFPQSMQRLLTDWCMVLDKAAMASKTTAAHGPTTADKIMWSNELKRVEAEMKRLRGKHYTDNDGWDDRKASAENLRLKYRKAELVKALGLAI